MSDLAPARLDALLRTKRFGRSYNLLATCASTNDEIGALAREGHGEGLVCASEHQSGGRGRLGRTWHSPVRSNLTFSLLLRPDGPPWALPPLTLLAGAVVASVLRGNGVSPSLKWPNDVLLDTPRGPRKVAGILTEMSSEQDRIRHAVLGVGINVNARAFPGELEPRATSLFLATGKPLDRGALLAEFLNAFEPAYDHMMVEGSAAVLALWKTHARLGERCRVARGNDFIEGIAQDIEPDGALRVLDDAGNIHRVVSGEIA